MLLTIITINFNNKIGLEKTVESVITQSFKKFEYIIIDGGSSDQSKSYLETIGSNYYWISEPDNGIYNAMNKGWKIAQGDYVLFLNSGDYFYHNRVLEQVIPFLKDSKADIIFGDLVTIKNNKHYIDLFKIPPTLYHLYYSYHPHCTSFIKNTLKIEIGYYDESYSLYADIVFFIKCIIGNKTFLPLQIPVAVFEGGGLSSKATEKMQQEKHRLINETFKFLHLEYQHYKELRMYQMSRPHQFLQRVIKTLWKKS